MTSPAYWPGNGVMEFNGSDSTGNNFTGNTLYLGAAPRVYNGWGGATGNIVTPNTVIRP